MPSTSAIRLTGCPQCGTLQHVPPLAGAKRLDCAVCDTTLERFNGRSSAAALAFSIAGLALAVPANLLPFMTTSIVGVSRQSQLSSSAAAMFDRGYPELATVIWLAIVALPIARFGLVAAVLGALRLGRHPRWLGAAFRHAWTLQTWAMLDVFLLGFVVAYSRLRSTLTVEIGLGAYCFVAAAVLTLLLRATLDHRAVWQAIGEGRGVYDVVGLGSSGESSAGAAILACESCGLLVPAAMEGSACPRCAVRLHARKPDALGRAAALTIAAALLYVPANIYPIATLPIGFTSVRYNVLEGVIDLVQSKLYGLAALVFVASFAIPLAKLGVLGWCIASVLRRSTTHLRAKTRAYRVVEEIGRWSMVDPFVIASFVPVTQYNALVHGNAEAAAPMFAGVVVLTMLATRCFDPRLLWEKEWPTKDLSNAPPHRAALPAPAS